MHSDSGGDSPRERRLPAPAVVYQVMAPGSSRLNVADEAANAGFFG